MSDTEAEQTAAASGSTGNSSTPTAGNSGSAASGSTDNSGAPTAGNGAAFDPITEPVLNTPYEVTRFHWQLDIENRAMADRVDGRRDSVAMLPVPEEHDPDRSQIALNLNPENKNATVNDIRIQVGNWRRSGRYEGATAASKRLLKFWQGEEHTPRLFFAQIEALETLIWLTEVAPNVKMSEGETAQFSEKAVNPLLADLSKASQDNNEGLERRAIKMATGTGKTVVMGMVIAWHAVNAFEAHKLPEEQRSRYLTSFLAITPGHTVRERLETLKPSPQGGVKSVYDEMNLLPPSDRVALNRVQVQIVNFQRFQPKDRLAEASGDAKRYLRAGNKDESDTEERSAMLRRVLRGLRGLTDNEPGQQICVLNDEAHHCYLPAEGRRGDGGDGGGDGGEEGEAAETKDKRTKEDKEEDKSAALWFSAIKSLDDYGWLGAVYDFSATPMFIQTSERRDTQMFPWVVSDYPLMDAIEAGLVKIPRVPVYDDSAAEPDQSGQAAQADQTEQKVKWRNLYKYVNQKSLKPDIMPAKLTYAINTFYKNYQKKFQAWEQSGMRVPPVFIVVANNIKNAEVLYHHLSGTRTALEDDSGDYAMKPSSFDLFSNFASGNALAENLNTLLVHSDLEGDKDIKGKSKFAIALSAQAEHLKKRVAQLKEAGKAAGQDITEYDDLSAKDLVRRALNTVGRPGELGANIRCVVSVSMLTEGWDTRTVTHVLGYRAFGTQLLCEQVTGRALRRTNYDDLDDEGRLKPQFADVIGIPFDFMPVGGQQPPDRDPLDTYEVESVAGRQRLRIEFPLLTGYLVEPSGIGIVFDSSQVKPYELEEIGPTSIEIRGVAGQGQTLTTSKEAVRYQQVVTKVAARLVAKLCEVFASESNDGSVSASSDDLANSRAIPRRYQLFQESVPVVEQWLKHEQVNIAPDQLWWLTDDVEADKAVAQIIPACSPDLASGSTAKRIGTFGVSDTMGSTEDVHFETSVPLHYPKNLTKKTKHSELNIAPCDSGWEFEIAKQLDQHPDVQAWARNTPQLGWTLPYQFEGSWHSYLPDFVVRLGGEHGGGHGGNSAIHLLIEVKGEPYANEKYEAKSEYALNWWIPAVRNSPQIPAHLSEWRFVELTDGETLKDKLSEAIKTALSGRKK